MTPNIDLRGKPSQADRAFRGLAIGAAAIVLLVLALIAFEMSGRMGPVLDRMGFSYFTSRRWSPAEGLFGALPFLWGTIYTAVIALVLAVPVSLFVALFVTQVTSARWRKPIIYVLDLLAVVPSVVYGLWGVLVLAQPLQRLFLRIHEAVDGIPGLQSVFGASPQGRSFMTAGVILTVDTHVKRLREKLGNAGTYIETLRGVGYRFAGENEDA